MNDKIISRIYQLILILFSIEYIGDGVLSVYRLIIFPLVCICLILLFSKPKQLYVSKLSFFISIVLGWLAICQGLLNSNILFPLFTLPLVLCVIQFMGLKRRIVVNYSLIFSLYSIPHILSVVFNKYELLAGRFCGLHNDPNFCGIYLSIAVIGAVFYVLNRENKKFFRILQILNIIISILLIFWTGSRGCMLIFLLVIAFYFYSSKKIYAAVKILITCCAIYSYFYIVSYIESLPIWVDPDVDLIDSILCRFQSDKMEGGSHRTLLWQTAFSEMEANSAYIIPIGSEYAMRSTPNGYAHNTFIDFLLEMGLFPGFLFDMVIFITILKSCKIIFNKKNNDEMLLLIFLSLLVLFQLFFLSAYSQKITWLAIVLLFSSSRNKRLLKNDTFNNNSYVQRGEISREVHS